MPHVDTRLAALEFSNELTYIGLVGKRVRRHETMSIY